MYSNRIVGVCNVYELGPRCKPQLTCVASRSGIHGSSFIVSTNHTARLLSDATTRKQVVCWND